MGHNILVKVFSLLSSGLSTLDSQNECQPQWCNGENSGLLIRWCLDRTPPRPTGETYGESQF